MRKAFFFYENPYRPGSAPAARALEALLAGQGVRIVRGPLETLTAEFDALVAFGGDGTLLRAAPACARLGVPIMGVHTGHVGFLMGESIDGLDRAARRLLAREYVTDSRALLSVSLWGEEYLALNDVAITRGEHPGVIQVRCLTGEEEIMAPHGDGLVISTPTGATAYALAAGGPVVRPDADCLLCVPVCPREMGLRPVILPGNAAVTLLAQSDQRRRLQLSIDGQTLVPLTRDARVEISKSPLCARLMYPGPFFETLARKRLELMKQE